MANSVVSVRTLEKAVDQMLQDGTSVQEIARSITAFLKDNNLLTLGTPLLRTLEKRGAEELARETILLRHAPGEKPDKEEVEKIQHLFGSKKITYVEDPHMTRGYTAEKEGKILDQTLSTRTTKLTHTLQGK